MDLPGTESSMRSVGEIDAEATIIDGGDGHDTIYYFKRFQIAALEHDTGYVRGALQPIYGILEDTRDDDEEPLVEESAETEIITLYSKSGTLYFPINNSDVSRQAQDYIVNGELVRRKESYDHFTDDSKLDVFSCRGDEYVLERQTVKQLVDSGTFIPVVPLVSEET